MHLIKVHDTKEIQKTATKKDDVTSQSQQSDHELLLRSFTFAGQDFLFAIVAVGEAPYAESGGDNSELTIPFNGAELVNLVAGKVPTIMILISGRPLVLEPLLLEKIDALVAAWLPGSEAAMTWFKSVEQLPMHAEQNSYDPLFPFGFGLTSKNKLLQD